MQIETKTVSGTTLDWLVAVCVYADSETHTPVLVNGKVVIRIEDYDNNPMGEFDFNPTEDWSTGGPIVEQMIRENHFHIEAVEVQYAASLPAFKASFQSNGWTTVWRGQTWLKAGLLAYVARIFGDNVEVPAELLSLT